MISQPLFTQPLLFNLRTVRHINLHGQIEDFGLIILYDFAVVGYVIGHVIHDNWLLVLAKKVIFVYWCSKVDVVVLERWLNLK